jgi:hypothetical protein
MEEDSDDDDNGNEGDDTFENNMTGVGDDHTTISKHFLHELSHRMLALEMEIRGARVGVSGQGGNIKHNSTTQLAELQSNSNNNKLPHKNALHETGESFLSNISDVHEFRMQDLDVRRGANSFQSNTSQMGLGSSPYAPLSATKNKRRYKKRDSQNDLRKLRQIASVHVLR